MRYTMTTEPGLCLWRAHQWDTGADPMRPFVVGVHTCLNCGMTLTSAVV